jgi:hypothetical protein
MEQKKDLVSFQTQFHFLLGITETTKNKYYGQFKNDKMEGHGIIFE